MQAVDDTIAALVETLQATGQLTNTYLIFTSDNGFHMGQHRLAPGKYMGYEEDVRVPFFVRGPQVPISQTLPHLASIVDLAPTLVDIAGIPTPPYMDGRPCCPCCARIHPRSPTGDRPPCSNSMWGPISGSPTRSVSRPTPSTRPSSPVCRCSTPGCAPPG